MSELPGLAQVLAAYVRRASRAGYSQEPRIWNQLLDAGEISAEEFAFLSYLSKRAYNGKDPICVRTTSKGPLQLRPGQAAFGYREVGNTLFGGDRSKARRAARKLLKIGLLADLQSGPKGTLVTVLDYDEIRRREEPGGPVPGPVPDPQSGPVPDPQSDREATPNDPYHPSDPPHPADPIGSVSEQQPLALSAETIPRWDLEALYKRYPKKSNKRRGLEKLKTKLKTQADFERCRDAIETMATAWEGQDRRYCPGWFSFVNGERWLDDDLPIPKPSTPQRGPQTEVPGNGQEDKPSVALPPDWTPTAAHGDLAAELRLDLEGEAERFRDHAEEKGRRCVSWDAAFRSWLRKSAEFRALDGPAGGDAAAHLPGWPVHRVHGKAIDPELYEVDLSADGEPPCLVRMDLMGRQDLQGLANALRAVVLADNPGDLAVSDGRWPSTQQAWAREFDAMVVNDGRTVDQIRYAIGWLSGDQMGGARLAVPDASALRRKFDAIAVQMRAAKARRKDDVTGDEIRAEAARLRRMGQ